MTYQTPPPGYGPPPFNQPGPWGYPPPAQSPPWHPEPVVAILTLFFCCWPLGLVVLWSTPKLGQPVKVGVTIGWLATLVAGALFWEAFGG